MNVQEYLLTCFNEELSEVQQEISKCIRFTPGHTPEGIYTTTNFERVQLEIADVFAISQLLRIHCDLDMHLELQFASEAIDARVVDKMNRTLKLMEVSVDLGALDASPD